jgi:RNA polymerase sigma-70 factor (ECF subfamily)
MCWNLESFGKTAPRRIYAKMAIDLLILQHSREYIRMNQSLQTPEDSHRLRVQQLFMVHQQALLAYLLSLVPTLQDAQDLLQDVFLVVSRKAETWSEGSNFLAWVCTIARYEALHFARTNKRAAVLLDTDVLELLHSESPTVDHLESQINRLKDCLQRLAPRARELVMLRYHAAEMPEAIAKKLNWTVGAVRVALSRAKETLRECINERRIAEELS